LTPEHRSRIEAVGGSIADAEKLLEDFPNVSAEDVVSSQERRYGRTPDQHLAEANELLGLDGEGQLLGIEDDGHRYTLVGRRGGKVCTERQWAEFRTARPVIEAAIDAVLPRHLSPAQWRQVRRHLLVAKVVTDLGALATEGGLAREWLTLYLDQHPTDSERIHFEIPTATGGPYWRDGRQWIFGTAFRMWLRIHQSEVVDHKRLGRMLRAAGCEPTQHHAVIDSRRTTRSVWSVPRDLLEGGE
jgi:hypothetical protein